MSTHVAGHMLTSIYIIQKHMLEVDKMMADASKTSQQEQQD
jgi:hypothetical protein